MIRKSLSRTKGKRGGSPGPLERKRKVKKKTSEKSRRKIKKR